MDECKDLTKIFKKNLPLFNALGDSTRQRLILLMIDGEPKSVAELTAKTDLSRPTISHHLKVLRDAHIIVEKKQGRKTFYYPQLGDYYYSMKEFIETIDTLTKKEQDK